MVVHIQFQRFCQIIKSYVFCDSRGGEKRTPAAVSERRQLSLGSNRRKGKYANRSLPKSSISTSTSVPLKNTEVSAFGAFATSVFSEVLIVSVFFVKLPLKPSTVV